MLVLGWCCAGVVLVLCLRCAGVVLVLCWCCDGVVLYCYQIAQVGCMICWAALARLKNAIIGRIIYRCDTDMGRQQEIVSELSVERMVGFD